MYADFVCDAVDPAQLTALEIDSLSLAFLNEARLGDILHVTGEELPGLRWLVRGRVGDRPCFEALLTLRQP